MRSKWLFLTVLLVPAMALAAIGEVTDPVSVAEFLLFLVKSMGGLGGASATAIGLIVVQVLMKFFATTLADFAGKWKLRIVTGLNVVAVFLAQVVAGADWKTALMNAAVFNALTVFLNQLVKQESEKPKQTIVLGKVGK